MESYMDWVNNHFTEANNGRYLEMYKLAEGSMKRFLDEGFDTVRYHEEGKDRHMCISFICDDQSVFVTFDQEKQKWLIGFRKVTKDKRGARAKCGIIEDVEYMVYKAYSSREAVKANIKEVIEAMERLQGENKR